MPKKNSHMTWRLVLAAVAVTGLVACARGPGARAPVAAGAASPPDPLASFAATAQPGSEGQIVLADGRSETVRLLRSYNAASGRQCREVLIGAESAPRTQLVCQTERGGWASVRPLLRGGGSARP